MLLSYGTNYWHYMQALSQLRRQDETGAVGSARFQVQLRETGIDIGVGGHFLSAAPSANHFEFANPGG